MSRPPHSHQDFIERLSSLTPVGVDSLRRQLEVIAIENFIDYIKIPTALPEPKYKRAVKFLKKEANRLGLRCRVFHPVDLKKPVVVISWIGSQPELPSILLNSHMDVAEVFTAEWETLPFDPIFDTQDKLYARGTQDGKCVGIQYLEAIRALRWTQAKIKRTIHVSFVPDSKLGGAQGMKSFVKSDEFKDLKVGFALSEGVANPNNSYFVIHGELPTWKLQVHCPGNSGDTSRLIDNTPGEKLRVVLDRFYDFRAQERARLTGEKIFQGYVTSINLLRIEGDEHKNVIPNNITATFDIRPSAKIKPGKLEAMMKKWCEEAGEGVRFTFLIKDEPVEDTKLDDSNPYWMAFKEACDAEKMDIMKGIFPTTTDASHIRAAGIPAIGFSPLSNTQSMLHENDEHLRIKVFLRGIRIYEKIILKLANF